MIIVVVITLILVGTALIPRSIKIRQKRAARAAAGAPAPDRGPTKPVEAGHDAFLAKVVVAKLTSMGVPVTGQTGTSYRARRRRHPGGRREPHQKAVLSLSA